MALFRRRKPLHWKLAEAGGVTRDDDTDRASAPAPPQLWNGAALAEPALHGIQRPRAWDAIVTAYAPDLMADMVRFVALADGALVVEEKVPRAAVTPLALAVDATLTPPYRAEAVRREDGLWAVSVVRVTVAQVAHVSGDELELAVAGGHRTLLVDGETAAHAVRGLERLGEAEGADYVVRGRRIQGDLWGVEAAPL